MRIPKSFATRAGVVAGALFLGACTVLPTGPSILVLPGTGSSMDSFRYDDNECRQYAYAQIGGTTAQQAANQAAVGSAVVGTAIGAAAGTLRGAYTLIDAPDGAPELIVMATGSGPALAVEAHAELVRQGVRARVVSFPSWELFDQQTQAYRDSVLPPSVTARLSVEAGVGQGWHRWVGSQGDVMSIEKFGASAPYKEIYAQYGLTTGDIVRRALRLLGRSA